MRHRPSRLTVALSAVRRRLPGWVLFGLPALLLLPALVYSLDTPYAFVDDHWDWRYVKLLADLGELRQSLVDEFIGGDIRFRPVFTYGNALAWKLYGETMWLHHLTRWLLHLGAVAVWAAAFCRFVPAGRRSAAVSLVPLGLLVWVWVFWPNAPYARLSPQEPYTVLFLGLCALALARIVPRQWDEPAWGGAWRDYGLLCAAFLGLAWSKETNLAAALWILLFCGGLALRRPARRTVLPLLPLLLIFLAALYRVYSLQSQGGYGAPTLTAKLVIDNADWLFRGLLQLETSVYVSFGFCALFAALLAALVKAAARRRTDARWVFAVFLLGLLAFQSGILLTSWYQALRYWYILIPVFAALLALGGMRLLEYAEHWGRAPGRGWARRAAPAALAGFTAFFIAVNYYNFLWQTVTQHSVRHAEAGVIAEIAARHDAGEYVRIPYHTDEHQDGLWVYFVDFAPYWRGRYHRVHREPPGDGRPYLEAGRTHDPIPAYPEARIDARRGWDYAPLRYGYRAADLLQAGVPHRVNDAGAADADTYGWVLYRRFPGDVSRFTAELIESSGPPLLRAHYSVYRTDRTRWGDGLLYVRDDCAADRNDLSPFFLHITPADRSDLPPYRRWYGFDNLDFSFEQRGWTADGRCLAWRRLPSYDVVEVLTGQVGPDGARAWQGRLLPLR